MFVDLICSYSLDMLMPTLDENARGELDRLFRSLMRAGFKFMEVSGSNTKNKGSSDGQERTVKEALLLRQEIRMKFPWLPEMRYLFWNFHLNGDLPVQLVYSAQTEDNADIFSYTISGIPSNELLTSKMPAEFHGVQTFIDDLDKVGGFTDLNAFYNQSIGLMKDVKSIFARVLVVEEAKKDGVNLFIKNQYPYSENGQNAALELNNIPAFINKYTEQFLNRTQQNPQESDILPEVENFKEEVRKLVFTIEFEEFNAIEIKPLQEKNEPITREMEEDLKRRALQRAEFKAGQFFAAYLDSFEKGLRNNVDFEKSLQERNEEIKTYVPVVDAPNITTLVRKVVIELMRIEDEESKQPR